MGKNGFLGNMGFLRSREERMEIQTAPRINERSVSLSLLVAKGE
jgi:hypothetical protein